MNKPILLHALALVSTLTLGGALVACGGSSSGSTPGSDASADSTSTDSGTSSDSNMAVDTSVPADGGDGATPTDSGTPADSGAGDASDAGGNPPMPPLGATQVDRVGRPAINTALNHSFDGSSANAGAAKDAYNASSDPTMWASSFATQFAANQGILDGLDGVCGNQFAYAAPASATSYSPLAGVLVDDRLYLNTAGATCTQYLAVEANALGVTNTDCGGRTLSEVTLDTTYSLMAIGALTGISNGITANNVAFSSSFPFLANPN